MIALIDQFCKTNPRNHGTDTFDKVEDTEALRIRLTNEGKHEFYAPIQYTVRDKVRLDIMNWFELELMELRETQLYALWLRLQRVCNQNISILYRTRIW